MGKSSSAARIGGSGPLGRTAARAGGLPVALALAFALVAACQSQPHGREAGSRPGSRPAVPAGPHSDFSALRATADVDALQHIGARVTGTRGSRRARSYIERQLAAMGARLERQRFAIPIDGGEDSTPSVVKATTIIGELPGASSDVVLLATRYDTAAQQGERGALPLANLGMSVASVLELGRVLSARERPYTIWLAFIDGDSIPLGVDRPTEQSPAAAFPGSEALASLLERSGALRRVRLAILFDRLEPIDPAGGSDLAMVHDLGSHPVHLDVLWRSAADFAQQTLFPGAARRMTVAAGHQNLRARGVRQVLAMSMAPRLARERASPEPGGASPCCAAETLRAIGVVTLESLDRIAARLDRIDRFAESPLDQVPSAPGSEGPLAPLAPAGADQSGVEGAAETSSNDVPPPATRRAEAGPGAPSVP